MTDHDHASQPDSVANGLWQRPPGKPLATLLLAHGAGAPMDSTFMQQISDYLVAQGLAVFRFEFPYMARRRQDGVRRPPDREPRLLQCWDEVYRYLRPQVTGPLLVGGKSMGGRMASLQVEHWQADGLVCLGYPFHPAGKPERLRTAHLESLSVPTLIVQGTRDALGNLEDVEGYRLSERIRLVWLESADHDLKPLKRSGYLAEDALQDAAQAIARFAREQVVRPGGDVPA